MKQANPVSDDMFEKAREAFFGTTKTSPKNDRSNCTDAELEQVAVITEREKVLTS
jgi:hypothetical protein